MNINLTSSELTLLKQAVEYEILKYEHIVSRVSARECDRNKLRLRYNVENKLEEV